MKSTTLHPSREAAVPGLVVIGASTGGVQALTTLVSGLPPDFPWAILVVLHIGNHLSALPDLLSSQGPLPAAHAKTQDRILPGRIYVAPPDRHLIVEDGHIQVTKGPKEHFTRPAIDPLFLSAALAYGRAVVGVVLTGTLDDGTAGLQAIKQCGGTTLVQDPEDAQEPSMPRSALRYVAIDHCSPVAGMAALLVKLTRLAPSLGDIPQPEHLVHEQALATAAGSPLEQLAAIARPGTLVRPDCQRHPVAVQGRQADPPSVPHGTHLDAKVDPVRIGRDSRQGSLDGGARLAGAKLHAGSARRSAT